MGIMQGLRKKEGRNARGGAATSANPVKLPDPTASLMLMLPDAGGFASYQLNEFSSAKAAEFYLDSSLRGKKPDGAVMFWALTWEPKGLADAEPLVLIRDGSKPIVYPFSFSDIESAFDFVRHEMQRGLHLFQVMIYWAVPANQEPDFWGRSTIVPASPPNRALVKNGASSFSEPVSSGTSAMAPTVNVPQIEAPAAEDDTERFLEDEDIAEAVRQANHIATHTAPEAAEQSNVLPMPAPAAPSRRSMGTMEPSDVEPIDFASASLRVEESRSQRAAVNAWSNFSQAVDEALDVYVARQVATKLSWNRLMRAFGHAMEAKRQKDVEDAEIAAREAAAAEAARFEKERLAAERAAAEEAARIATANERARKLGLVLAWGNGASAMADSVRASQHRTMVRRSVSAGTTELAKVARLIGRQKALRKAWLNVSWTMEEAAYAYALEQKSRAIRTWRLASIGIAEGAQKYAAHKRAMETAWSNAGYAFGRAHRAQVAHHEMLVRSWVVGSKQIRLAVITRGKLFRARNGMGNVALAIEEALEAKAYRDEMIDTWDAAVEGLISASEAKKYIEMMEAVWGNVAFALEGVCRAYVRKQTRAMRAWSRLGIAFGSACDAKREKDAATAAWLNASFALEEAFFAKRRYLGMVAAWRRGSAVLSDSARRRYRGMVFAWKSAGMFLVEAVEARLEYEAAVAAWKNAAVAMEEAAVACARYGFLVDAWESAGFAMRDAVEAYLRRKAGLESAWRRLAFAMDDAVAAMIFRDQSIDAWANAMDGIGEMVRAFVYKQKITRLWRNAGLALGEAVPVHLFKLQSIDSWQTAIVAFKMALVADAKLRIAAADLDRKQMAAVEKQVKAALASATGRPAGSRKNGKKAAAVEHVDFVPSVSLKTSVALPKEFLPDEFFEDEAEDVTVPEVEVVEEVAGDLFDEEPETDFAEEPIAPKRKAPLFPGLWRMHDSSRWKPRDEPFRGFQSPPGRFHHTEREDKTLP
jgi:hypothetical protein